RVAAVGRGSRAENTIRPNRGACCRCDATLLPESGRSRFSGCVRIWKTALLAAAAGPERTGSLAQAFWRTRLLEGIRRQDGCPSLAGVRRIVDQQRPARAGGGRGVSTRIPSMSEVLTSDQIADLAGISQICNELKADLVVI